MVRGKTFVHAMPLDGVVTLSAFALWQGKRKKTMIRFSKAIAAAALAFVMPTMASALGIQLVGVSGSASTSFLYNGDTITFDLRLENSGAVPINALEVLVSGFDTPGTTNVNSSGLTLVGGQVAPRAFDDDLNEIAGMTNLRSAPTTRWQLNLLNPEEIRTSLFLGANTLSVSGTGADDAGCCVPGVDVGAGDIHFRVTYQLVTSGVSINTKTLNLNFGVNPTYGAIAVGPLGETLPFTNAQYSLQVIPEPGTALLMGLGLAALATRRR